MNHGQSAKCTRPSLAFPGIPFQALFPHIKIMLSVGISELCISLNFSERNQNAGIELNPLNGLKCVKPLTHKVEV